MDVDWRNAFGILMCTEICDGAGAGIWDGSPSTCSSCKWYHFSYVWHKNSLLVKWAAKSENIPFGRVRPAKIQMSLRTRTLGSESSLAAFCITKYAKFLHAENEDSDQTARMRRLICVFVELICQKVRFLTVNSTNCVQSLKRIILN